MDDIKFQKGKIKNPISAADISLWLPHTASFNNRLYFFSIARLLTYVCAMKGIFPFITQEWADYEIKRFRWIEWVKISVLGVFYSSNRFSGIGFNSLLIRKK